MQYCTVLQVLNRNAARGTYTASSIPNASQVLEYVLESGAQLDQWLFAGGYAAPFDAAIASSTPSNMLVATQGQLLLQRWNSIGAALAVEEAAQQPINLEAFQKMWDEVKQVILDKTIDIPLPPNPAKAHPRAPGVPGSVGGDNPPQFTFDRTSRVSDSPGSWDL